MAKKIYDIVPPKLAKKIEKSEKDFLFGAKKSSKRPIVKRSARKNKEGRPLWIPVSIGAGVILVVVGIYLFFKLPKAEVSVWPKIDVLSFQENITAKESADIVDLDTGVIPAKYFEATKSSSQDFLATGNASDEGKASGIITIYNKYDPVTPLTLKSGTHFLSDSGKLFVASQRIVIPAGKKNGGKVTPGSVKVTIQAVEGGENYNIAPANFSVPGLKGTAFYYSIYAESIDPMEGGYSTKIKKITSDDLQEAEDALTEQVITDAVSELRGQIPEEYVILDDAISFEVTDSSTTAKAGTVADSFTYQATVKTIAVAFKKSDLDKLAKDYIISQMPDNSTLLEPSFNIDYSVETVDVSGGKIILDAGFSSGVYQTIDKNSLSLLFSGKSSDQIKEIVKENLLDNVDKTDVRLWPFWVTRAPESQKAINLELKFE